MRVSLILLVALSLAACSDEKSGSTADFKPRPALNRADFIAKIGQHFTGADRNHDEVLEASDFPRFPDRLKLWDKQNTGKVTRDQFRAAEIARFDAADTDKNGVLTGAERVRADWSGMYGKAKN